MNCYAPVAQSVERVLGKDEVSGSNPLGGSRNRTYQRVLPEEPANKPKSTQPLNING